MSDLSRLLEDVYGDGGSTPPAVPDWSSDEALDDTFASWVPGPPADAPKAERAYAAAADALDADPVRERPTFDEVFAAFGPDDASELVPEPVAVAEIPVLDDDPVDEDVAELAGLTGPIEIDVEPIAAAPEPAPVPILPAPPLRWSLSDDDILPTKADAKRRKPAPVAAAPKARFQLGRRASAPDPVEAVIPVADPEPAPAPEPALADADEQLLLEAPKRKSFRRPAPKHAKPKAGLQRTRRSSAKDDSEAPVADAPTRRKSFRLR